MYVAICGGMRQGLSYVHFSGVRLFHEVSEGTTDKKWKDRGQQLTLETMNQMKR